MRTLQEKYNGVVEDKFSKAQFKRDAIMECSHLVSHFNSFDDVVNILKNRGVIVEAKKAEPQYSTASAADHIAPDVLDTGIKFECDKKHGTLDISAEEYAKCRETAIKNLSKDVLYYVKKDSVQLETPKDAMEKVTLKEEATGDLADVMLRAQEYAAKNYPALDSDDIGDFLQLHGQEILDGDDLETSFNDYVYHNFPMDESVNENQEAHRLHQLLGCGMDPAEEFIAANNFDVDKFAADLKKKPELKGVMLALISGDERLSGNSRDQLIARYKKAVSEGEWEDKGQSKELNKKRLEDLKAKRAKGGPKGALAVMDKEIAQLEKLVNEGDIKLSAEDMEKLHKDGKITLPNGSVLHFVGKADEEVDGPDVEDLYQNDDKYLATLKQRKREKTDIGDKVHTAKSSYGPLKEAIKSIIRNVLQS